MIPTTMKAAVFTGPGKVEVRELPVPQLTDRQVLVQVKACAICTWEQRFYKGSKPEDYPFRGGHEVSGIVAAKGPRAQCDAEIGDPCALEILTRCGQCYYCRRGMDNLCEHDAGGQIPGQMWGPGGMAEYVVAEDYMVYRVEADCITNPERDFAAFALAEPVSCVARGIRRTPLQFGDTTVVQGAGVMGLIHLELLRRRGVRVVMSEPDPERREFALRLGAAAAFDPLSEDLAETVKCMTGGRGAEAIFFTAGGVPALRAAMPALGKGGWLMMYGSIHPKGDLPIDPNDVHYRELVVTGTFSHDKESFREAVALMNLGQIDLAPFVTERFPLEQIDHAMQRAMSRDTYRVVLTF